MSTRISRGIGLAIGAALACTTALAASDGPILSLSIDNDAVIDHDRHYTSGLKLAWVSGPIEGAGLRGALPFVEADTVLRAEVSLGQHIYTPTNLDLVVPDPSDRPYAGWLYLNVGVLAETGDVVDQLQFGLGLVGPDSLAEDVQDGIHNRNARGWNSQLQDEVTVQLTYQRSWRRWAEAQLGGLSLDVTPHLGAALGTAFIYANAGGMVRLGQNLPNDLGPPLMEPTLGGSSYFASADGFGWYVFAGFDARLIGRNLFLDGSTFRDDSPSVDSEPFVIDGQLGVAVVWDDVRLSYTQVWRSDEFEGQTAGDTFGSLTLAVRF